METFEHIIDRKHQLSAKYDELEKKFGRKDLLPMWVADMDFQVAPEIWKAVEKRGKEKIYGYTSRPDTYWDAAIRWYQRRYDMTLKQEDLIHSPGVVTSLNVIIRELTREGDKIIIQTPVYPPFYDAVRKNQRVLVENPLLEENGQYYIHFEELEKQAEEASMLILCNPHNPVGRVWTKEELERIGDICRRHQVIILADEIHGDLVFGDRMYTPMASLSKEIQEITITCFSATKSFNLAGLQASFIHAPQAQYHQPIQEFFTIMELQRNDCFSVVAVEAAFNHGEEWLNKMLAYVEENMAYVENYCRENIPELKANLPEGTYLQWINCKGLGLKDDALKKLMIDEAKVALNMGVDYGATGTGYVRLNLACPRSIVEKAMKNIEEAVKKRR
ncbi:MalY/PatB family protein [Tindallia californiensis]|uniref:cysteine-S-conjugate beta-lyase n=1 Tax=Tindallia californiensis TaxID=159292 RepID=A0A1H3Q3U5_9FIRM|nr:PatB family C-S lyase [Tindallia californiensis]SDZ07778.1 cystathione beta-lyase [Tindallia californiensis]